jgi:putative endopeptidase
MTAHSGISRAYRAAILAVALLAGSAAVTIVSAAGLDLSGIDRSVKPGDDFFRFANGRWLESTEIPADRSTYGTGAIVAELTLKRTADLIVDVSKDAPGSRNGSVASAEARKVGDYYAAFMDEAGIEKRGLTPLQPQLERIGAIADRRGLARALGATLRADVDVLNSTNLHTPNLFGLWVAQDLDDPSHYSPFLLQGGLGMPDREYYLDTTAHMTEMRARYEAHIAALLGLAGVSDAAAKAKRIIDLEHRIAEAHVSRADSEDVQKGNNHWLRKEFLQRAPGLDWDTFFSAAGLDHQARFVVWQPQALIGLSALTAREPLQTWKDYLLFHAIEHVAIYLPNAFVAEHFKFNGTALLGTPALQPRWKRAIDATNRALGDAVGKLYVQRYFPPEEKARAQALVRNLVTAFGARIDKLDWMAPETKARAKAKLAALKVYVGYPEQWRDYSGLQVIRDDALGNAQRAELFEYQHNLDKLSRSVDRSEWALEPQVVDAINLPAMNAIDFPAAILQPPYFDAHRAVEMDYAAIGAIIGHEISHGFDDQGAQFDAQGRLSNWWTAEDLAHFKAAAARLVAQYDAYKPFPDLAVNGKQTLSENIADVAGLAVAYDAYHLALRGPPAPAVGGFNTEQLFFLSFGQMWRNKFRDAALRLRIVADGHSPSEYRCDTVRNLTPWYAAFDVQPGQRLFLQPDDRVSVW